MQEHQSGTPTMTLLHNILRETLPPATYMDPTWSRMFFVSHLKAAEMVSAAPGAPAKR